MYAYPVCWVRYREPEPLPAVAKLKTLIASPKLFTLLRNVDKNGIGYVSRSEMIRTMAQLGYDNLSQITLLSMLKFFETKLEGQVNYINLLQYIHENTESQSLIHAESKLHCFCMDSDRSGLPNEDKIRALFAQIDSTGQGAFTLSDFSHFLDKIDENLSKNVKNAFYSEFLSSNGKDLVDFGLFLSWFNTLPSVRSEISAVLGEVCPPHELKTKTTSYLKECGAGSMLAGGGVGVGVEAVWQSYRVYDWRRTSAGVVDLPCFVKATKRVGFPFTIQEIRALATEFRHPSPDLHTVDYKRFLEWGNSTQTSRSGNNAVGTSRPPLSFSGNNANMGAVNSSGVSSGGGGSIIRFLEKALLRGIDLLSIFGRYDSLSAGRVTALEFCSALSDLVTHHASCTYSSSKFVPLHKKSQYIHTYVHTYSASY